MADIFSLTLINVLKMLILIALGYALRRSKSFPESSGKTLSVLVAMIFTPAYNIHIMANDFTADKVNEKLIILGIGALFTLAIVVVGFVLSIIFGRDELERRVMTYTFAFPNYGYFGLPLVQSIFGSQVLADFFIFTTPMAITINIFGYWLLTNQGNFSLKNFISAPIVWSPILGAILGLTGVKLPVFANELLTTLSGCMSPTAMILLGFVLGGVTLKEMFTLPRAYGISLIRLLLLPAIGLLILYPLGVRGLYLLLPMLLLVMPIGSNIVVFPESCGIDTKDNARTVFVSYVLAIGILPATFSLIAHLTGL